MSINHLINDQAIPKYDIYTNDITLEGKIENAKVSAGNGDVVDFSSLPSFGNGGQLLTSDGDGTLSWTDPSGGIGVNYNGNVPTQIGKIAIYGAVNGQLIKDSTLSDTDILNKNGDSMLGSLNMNNNTITNVFRANIDRINTASTNIDIEKDLFLRDNNITKVANLNLDTLTANNLSSITFNSDTTFNNLSTFNNVSTYNADINMFSNNILSVNNVRMKSFSSTDTKTQEIDANAHLDFDTLFDVRNVSTLTATNVNSNTTSTLVLNGGISPDIDVNANLNLDSLYEIKNCLNITTSDINTDTISAIAPATSVLMQNDLDMNGNNLLNITSINNINPSGGVYSNTGGFSFNGITAEVDILASGTSYGTKSIPANGFSAGDIYTLKIGGQITCANNDTFDIRIVSNFGLPSECEFSSFTIQIDGARTNGFFEIEVDFSIRQVGGAGVGIITTNGDFTYYNNTNVQKGFGISNINNTTFNTLIDNELSITYATAVAISSFQIDQASLMKFF